MAAPTPIREIGPDETGAAYTALYVLRPHLPSRDEFIRLVNEIQRPEGYRLAGIFSEDGDEAVAVVGFRHFHTLAAGHVLALEDLVTLPSTRGKGYGGALIQWLREEALRLGCDEIQHDAGHQRYDAHRLFIQQGLKITAHHFSTPTIR